MITTGHLTRPFVENVREAYKIIGLPRGRAYLQEHDESFYCHVLNQKPELWSRKVGLFFLKDEEASFSELSISRKTKPATVTVKRGAKSRTFDRADGARPRFLSSDGRSDGE